MKRSHILLYVILSCVITFLIYYPNLSAQWGIIDDHEIMAILGPDHKLTVREIPNFLMESEFANPGIQNRYRPFYYIFRFAEAASWGNDPFLWYSFRVFLCISTFSLLFLLMASAFGHAFGIVGTLCLLSIRSWADLWARLGPSETYSAPLTALYCYAYLKLWAQNISSQSLGWWLVLVISAVLAMGTKENFLLLGIASLPLTYRTLKHLPKSKLQRFAVISLNVILYMVFMLIVGVLYSLFRNQGADLYANPVSFMSRILVFLKGFLTQIQLVVHIPFVISIAAFVAGHRLSNPELWEDIKQLALVELLLIAVWDSQFIFYSGKWPSGNRYDFPGVIAGILAYFVLAYFTAKIIADIYPNKELIVKRSVCALILLYVLGFGMREIIITNDIVKYNSKMTKTFTARMYKIYSTVLVNQAIPIVIKSESINHFEPIYSMRKFLWANGVKKNIFLVNSIKKEEITKTKLNEVLYARLAKLSEEGDLGKVRNKFTTDIYFLPISQIDESKGYYSLTFSDSYMPSIEYVTTGSRQICNPFSPGDLPPRSESCWIL